MQIFTREAVQEGFIVPAVAEPLIVWIVKGSATVEERIIGGDWLASEVQAGDFFLTHSDEPYELRWRSHDGAPFEVMHLYLGISARPLGSDLLRAPFTCSRMPKCTWPSPSAQ